MKNSIVLLALVLLSQFVIAQRMPELVDSRAVIEAGIEHHDSENYDAALIEYYKVPKYDTNYAWALYESAMTQFAMGDYEKSIKTSKEVIKVDPNESNAYVNLGNSYDELKNFEEAEKWYDLGIEKFPYNHMLYVNKAIMFEKREENKKAFDTYQKLIDFNPMYPSTHLHLGYMNIKEGNLAQGFLSLSMFLMLEPSSSRTYSVLSYMETAAGMQSPDYDIIEKKQLENGFKDLDQLIANKIALNPKYKTPSKLQVNAIKQMHLILTEMGKGQGSGFYKDFYGDIYKQMMDKGQFKTYATLLVAAGTSSSIKKALAKDLANVKAMHQWFKSEFRSIHKDYELTHDGKTETWAAYFNDDLGLLCFGHENADEKPSGEFIYYYSDGRIRSKGELTTEGNRNGKWDFYNQEGARIRTNTYSNGKLQGNYKIYFDHGTLKEEGSYNNDKVDGPLKVYHANGALWIDGAYVEGEQQGPFKQFYGNGQLKYEYTNKDGKLDGVLKYYYANGNLADEKTFVEDKLEGERREYFENGQLQSIKTYDEGVLEGPYKTYYSHGQVSGEGDATKGNMSGKWTYYNEDGSIKEVSVFGENGKVTGEEILYDYNGKPYRKAQFVKGDIKSYQLIAEDGSVLEEAKESKGTIHAKSFSPFRTVIKEGDIVKGDYQGEWKYYYTSGAISSKRTFKDGSLNGDYTDYYANGKTEFKLQCEDGDAQGLIVGYQRDGKTVRYAGNYLDDEKWGMWRYYYPDGTLKSESYLSDGEDLNEEFEYAVNGKLEEKTIYNDEGYIVGIVKYDSNGNMLDSAALPQGSGNTSLKFANGQVRWDAHYIEGKAEGVFTWSYPNGNLSAQGKFVASNREGDWIFNYPWNKPREKGAYSAGSRTGLWTEYDIDGEKSYERTYLHGNFHGTNTYYYPNGKVEITMEYAYGEKHGPSHYYDMTGELQVVRFYDHGKLVGYSYNDASGKLKPTIEIEKETVDIKAFFANGKPSAEYSLKNGWFQGPCKLYNAEGKVQRECIYKDDYRDESFKEYFANGKPYLDVNYKYGDRHGSYKQYYANGKPKIVGQYRLGEGQGAFTYYTESGQSLGTYIYHNGNCVEIK